MSLKDECCEHGMLPWECHHCYKASRAERDRLREQRDVLLEAAKMAEAKMCSCFHSEQVDWHGPQCPKPALRAAIAKAKGKA